LVRPDFLISSGSRGKIGMKIRIEYTVTFLGINGINCVVHNFYTEHDHVPETELEKRIIAVMLAAEHGVRLRDVHILYIYKAA
jgi:hypothetical protein